MTDAGGGGLGGATLLLSGGGSQTALSAADGGYGFTSLAGAAAYTVTPAKAGYTFTPATQYVSSLTQDQLTADFVATAIAAPGGSAAAAFVRTDATSEGTWSGVYGTDGHVIVGAAASYPAYASVSVAAASTWTWSGSTTDPRALQRPGSADRLAACWYSDSGFTIDVNLSDGKAHQVALYSVDWDGQGRSIRVDVLDASTGSVLDTRALSSFQDGRYLVWSLTGHVTLRVANTGPRNAVASGIFFDSPGGTSQPPVTGTAAAFARADVVTRGSWRGVYGNQGYAIESLPEATPSWATTSVTSAAMWTWSGSTTDDRALERPGDDGRLAGCWYSDRSFTVDVAVTDGGSHQVALYLVDWDAAGRSQRVDVLDAATGAVLDTRSVAAFQGGQFLVWTVSGRVTFRVTNTGSPNAVLSGVFFD